MGSLFQLGFVLMAVGMLIAYIGDRLGTFVGKKRISKFGLRPRHTAILYTTITGGIIPLLTLLVFVWIRTDFEHAVTDYGNVLAKTNRLIKQNKDLAQSAVDAQAKASQSEAELASVKAHEARASKSAADRIEALHAKEAVQEAIYTNSIKLSQSQLASANASLGNANADLTAAKAQLASARTERHQTAESLKLYERRVADAQKTVEDKERDVARLNNHYRTLIALNDDLQHRNQQLETTNVYHTGDELGRTVLYTSETPDQIRTRLTGWLESLSRTAAHRGAGTGPNGRDIVVQGDGSEAQDQSIPEDDSLDTLAEHIAQSGSTVGSVVVVANARFNSTLGEQVRLDIQSFDNLLVFSKGDAVATTVIDGRLPQEQVVNQLVHFVSEKVQRVAIEKAIMPTIDANTLGRSYGQADHLLDTAAKIQEAGTSTQVVAVASDDVFTNGPLTVHLEVVPPTSTPSAESNSTHNAHPLDTAVRDTAPSMPGESLTGHSGGHRNPSTVTGL